jgi:hypothetical protein
MVRCFKRDTPSRSRKSVQNVCTSQVGRRQDNKITIAVCQFSAGAAVLRRNNMFQTCSKKSSRTAYATTLFSSARSNDGQSQNLHMSVPLVQTPGKGTPDRGRTIIIKRLHVFVLCGLMLSVSIGPTPGVAQCQEQTCDKNCGDGVIACINNNPQAKAACVEIYQLCMHRCPRVPTVTESVRPKYQVITVIYAPPGTAGSWSASSVSYANSRLLGTMQSMSSTEMKDLNLTVGFSVPGTQDMLGGNYSYSHSHTDQHATDISFTYSDGSNYYGPKQNGINHDYD